MKKINVAIDGPAGAGKSTVAKLVADELKLTYIDTGAMYRAITWKVMDAGISVDQIDEVVTLMRNTELSFESGGEVIFADGINITNEIRDPNVGQLVSHIAKIREVREILVAKQKQLADAKGVVMDGRDIGTEVIPDAEVKIYLTASVEARATRRYEQLKANHVSITFEQLKQEIMDRDHIDQNREVSPLQVAKDAVVIDATELSIEEVVQQIITQCRQVSPV
ncbi:(d)CMP kinase [Longirhabdus pacifica]|uniref:(d)CMP kinase n=1 Tax=Longirhabdus pacifica TaxID=2305227 RepID=UPI001008A71C|nr:(d)CMP kinase [Longirhabdus pacifica]